MQVALEPETLPATMFRSEAVRQMRFPFQKAFLLCAMTAMGLGSAKAQYAGHISSYVMDARTGAVLSATDAELQRYPAS